LIQPIASRDFHLTPLQNSIKELCRVFFISFSSLCLNREKLYFSFKFDLGIQERVSIKLGNTIVATQTLTTPKRVISVFILAMSNVAIMASLRNLPLIAEFGWNAIFFFLIVGIGFLIPCALVSAELATGWPKSGGIYVWVREAFGDRWGFFSIWMQWVHNVSWYPAILSFVAATLAYACGMSSLAANKYYILTVVLVIFWGMTALNYCGIKTSSVVSTVGVIIGTILPGLVIIGLALVWLGQGHPLQIKTSAHALIPNFHNFDNIIFMGGFFLTFAGLEVSSGYAGEVKNPQKNYPRSILLAAAITFVLLLAGALSIAFVIPKAEISLVSGVMDAFKTMLSKYHLVWFLPIIGVLLAVGSVAEVNSWIMGPVKALYTTSIHGNLPKIFQNQNKHGMPTNLLLFQAIIVTVSSLVFLFMPNLSSSYWILSALSAQMYLVMYLFMFVAAIKLRYTQPLVPRAYRIPHPKTGMWLIACLGIISSLFAIIITFWPPKQLHVGSIVFYESFLVGGLVLMMIIPLVIYQCRKPHWMPVNNIHQDSSLVNSNNVH
jgi:glutamate:GABA antiporter